MIKLKKIDFLIMEYFTFNLAYFINDILIPCILAFSFGAVIGFQRERINRPAGLRTHTLVCLGATAFTIVSFQGFTSLSGVDPSRVAAGILTGIGFIGAGAIFKTGNVVKGVTTAASIWIVAAVGMALGTKLYYLAFLITVLGFIILTTIKILEDRVIGTGRYIVTLRIASDGFDYKEITDIITSVSKRIRVHRERIEYEEGIITLRLKIDSLDQEFSVKVTQRLKEKACIKKISIN